MLKISDLHAYYGQLEALKGINMQVDEGKIVCLIGSNGAGKTTLLNSISRMIRTEGSIKWDDSELNSMNARKVAKFGIMHVPSGRHVFPGLTVRENLELGTVNWRGAFGAPTFQEDLVRIYDLFPRLKEREKQLSWSLSGGEQQMLAIGRAMMGRPQILLLDEPSMGLAPVVVNELFEKIVEINKTGMTILLVEQNAKIALRNSHYAYVIEQGRIIMEGESAVMRDDPRVTRAYLGKLAEARAMKSSSAGG
ncbi:leucine/isoleucine/valine transporter subunit; ATP-binding component of ABC superfamily [uncultured Eubacteriales bacterium]|uniref:Leucine/isoleucine/valine transporter subunit ATP-binding component of ABC superfamily n=1 Tax=uncultured Eubacteriales bacterium TaxID=172733 RepID=A0A212KHC7_9FIRM|nr:leucine/isoleucine/valine transporter subunit; ATP-binding component of ABC superfamily [uncultured Eubacteriales bacterium]